MVVLKYGVFFVKGCGCGFNEICCFGVGSVVFIGGFVVYYVYGFIFVLWELVLYFELIMFFLEFDVGLG